MVASAPRQLTLLRAPSRPEIPFDEQQREVIAHRGGPLVVLGGPGTGKSATLVARAQSYINEGFDPNKLLVITFDRHRASELNDEIFADSTETSAGSMVKTFPALAFAILRIHRAQTGKKPPRLRTGPEQDYLIRELLAGSFDANTHGWPEHLRDASQTRAFAAQLRDLISRAVEYGLSPAALSALGESQNLPLWKSAGSFMQEYLEVSGLENENAFDPSEMIYQATQALEKDEDFRKDIRARHQVILVDEFQESDQAHRHLLELIATDELTLFLDPDSAVGRFRGADPESLPDIFERYRGSDGQPARKTLLNKDFRAIPPLTSLTKEIASRFTFSRMIEQRNRVSAREELPTADSSTSDSSTSDLSGADAISIAQCESVHDEARFIAERFQQLHFRDGLPYSEMAVIIRSPSTRATTLRRIFASMNIPVREEIQSLPLNAQPAVAPLITLASISFALNRPGFTPEKLEELLPNQLIDELLLSRYGGADFLTLKRIRATIINSRESDDSRSSYQILREYMAISMADVDWSEFAPVKRIADLIASGRKVARSGGTSEDVLWAIWSSAEDEDGSALAQKWQRDAINGDESADRDLDGVLALFEAAARYADQRPGNSGDAFIRQLVHESIASDTIAAQAQRPDVVSILTTHAAKGRQWSAVAVAGVEEGIWPNLTPRGSLLGSERLVETMRAASASDRTSREFHLAALSALKDDERRLFFHALTRARNHLIITASAAEDSRPSQFFNEVAEVLGIDESALTAHQRSAYLTPSRLVATLRTITENQAVEKIADASGTGSVGDSAHAVAGEAVAILAHLHRAGVRVANPDSWYGAREISSEIPLFSDEEQIKISPSSLDTLNKCALKWAFEHAGGRDSDSTSQILGTALHFVATKLITKAPLSELLTDLETIWQKLAEQTDLAKGWYGQAQLIRAREIVENIFTYHSESDRELVAVEAPFTITQERTVIKGSIDRLEKTEQNKAFVVDLKTGESAVSKKDAQENLQLKVYQLAVNLGQFATLLPEATAAGAELFYPAVNVAGANRPQDEIVDSEVSESITKLSDIAAATKFLAVENELCRSCHLRNSCPVKPEGRALR